jgi:hypothetical protein
MEYQLLKQQTGNLKEQRWTFFAPTSTSHRDRKKVL